MINRQKHSTTCGIVALHNALQWAGKKSNYYNLIKYAGRHYGYTIDGGMWYCNMKDMLKRKGLRVKTIRHVTFQDIQNEIDKGRSVILQYRHCKEYGHYTFISDYTDKFFVAYNNSHTNTTPYYAKHKLAEYLRYSHRWHGDIYPKIIVIL